MIATRLFLIVSIVSLFSLGIGIAFAETESFTVAARDYERKYIDLKEGDEIEYSIRVSGGANDDIKFTIYYPNGSNDGEALCMKNLVTNLRHNHLAHIYLNLTVPLFLVTNQ